MIKKTGDWFFPSVSLPRSGNEPTLPSYLRQPEVQPQNLHRMSEEQSATETGSALSGDRFKSAQPGLQWLCGRVIPIMTWRWMEA